MSDIRGRIYFDVSTERERQDAKWGDQSGNPPTVWAAVLAEECGEAAQAALHVQFEHRLTVADLRKELVQTAAVAVAWIEAIDEGTEETHVARADAPSPLRAAGAPSEGARLE
jgi:NTP pyrophosphatase (non-canonical NTP hydrolase)